MSRDTLKKFKPWWRIVAIIQNIHFPPPDKIADNDIDLCTSKAFKQVTGKLFNNKKEIIKPSSTQNPGLIELAKQLLGSSVYPSYADHEEAMEEVWNLCTKLTKERVN